MKHYIVSTLELDQINSRCYQSRGGRGSRRCASSVVVSTRGGSDAMDVEPRERILRGSRWRPAQSNVPYTTARAPHPGAHPLRTHRTRWHADARPGRTSTYGNLRGFLSHLSLVRCTNEGRREHLLFTKPLPVRPLPRHALRSAHTQTFVPRSSSTTPLDATHHQRAQQHAGLDMALCRWRHPRRPPFRNTDARATRLAGVPPSTGLTCRERHRATS